MDPSDYCGLVLCLHIYYTSLSIDIVIATVIVTVNGELLHFST